MRISNRKYAITGAGRGLGAALAITMADAGCRVVLLGRHEGMLTETARTIKDRTGQVAATISCDLADAKSCSVAGTAHAANHEDLDGVIHNGAMWLTGPLSGMLDEDIQSCLLSAASGALILTRHVLPNLLNRPDADIHTVVSTSGIQNRKQSGGGVPFRASKSAQAGMVQGLADELADTNVRVSAVFPSYIDDISPLDAEWTAADTGRQSLSNREVVEAILFMLNVPPSVTVSSLVIE
ncbi:SDR family oxidoreductase [Roseibium denhamense]|uniref:NADP-dependent 3-hydroxy acid dehydrogenase YdfG n=1 Tax=Roseibium denhamense TaxID=76305 RepID=A0ABY1NAK0_9HYPH|nr:SDR family oxidoreductase [Roseibium denhamense]MTI05686.1 SDR family oxidoreductase [Roseibium denhamense]SMP04190.1 NADP-dependent 3-hydroxy acid dehydrogenase YdfG [Roseibium denhamense]